MTKTFAHRVTLALTLFAPALSGCVAQAQSPRAPIASVAQTASVALLETPDGGIQPQAAIDSKGVMHLIYFKGKPMAGDVFYVRREAGSDAFSVPIRVNSQPDSVVAMGTIRGAQMTIGKGNRVHVAWNGSNSAGPKGAGGAPLLYTRLNDAGTAFEPQRNLLTWAGGLDGGATIAAGARGDVFVAWHAAPTATEDAGRAVYLARSTDDGRTFAREKKINTQPSGACGCCQMRALVDSKGVLSILYRAAGDNVHRDSMLLLSRDAGLSFKSVMLHPWSIGACPMSSYALAQNGGVVRAARETDGQIYSCAIQPATLKFSFPIAMPGKGENRKHPVAVFNARGEMLLAWTEGTGWNEGGSLAWQIYDARGKPTAEKGRADGVATWSLLSAIARPDGGFLLIH